MEVYGPSCGPKPALGPASEVGSEGPTAGCVGSTHPAPVDEHDPGARALIVASEFRRAAEALVSGLAELKATERQLTEARDEASRKVRETVQEVRASLKKRKRASIRVVEETFDARAKALRAQADVAAVSIEQLLATAAWCERAAALHRPAESVGDEAGQGCQESGGLGVNPRDADTFAVVRAALRMRPLCDTPIKPPPGILLLDVAADTGPVGLAISDLVRVIRNEFEATIPTRALIEKVVAAKGPSRLMDLLQLVSHEEFAKYPMLWRDWGEALQTYVSRYVERWDYTDLILATLARVFGDAPARPPILCTTWVAAVVSCLDGVMNTNKLERSAIRAFDEAGGFVHLLWILLVFLPGPDGNDPPEGKLETWFQMDTILRSIFSCRDGVDIPTFTNKAPALFAAVCGLMKANHHVEYAQEAGLAIYEYLARNGHGEVPHFVQAAVVQSAAVWNLSSDFRGSYDGMRFAKELVGMAEAVETCLPPAAAYNDGGSPTTAADLHALLLWPPSNEVVERFLTSALEHAPYAAGPAPPPPFPHPPPPPVNIHPVHFNRSLVAMAFLPGVFQGLASKTPSSGDTLASALVVYGAAATNGATPDELRITAGTNFEGLRLLLAHVGSGMPMRANPCVGMLRTLLALHSTTMVPALVDVGGVGQLLTWSVSCEEGDPCSILTTLSQYPGGAVAIATAWLPEHVATIKSRVIRFRGDPHVLFVSLVRGFVGLCLTLAADEASRQELLTRVALNPNWWNLLAKAPLSLVPQQFTGEVLQLVALLVDGPGVVDVLVSGGWLCRLAAVVDRSEYNPSNQHQALRLLQTLVLRGGEAHPATVADAAREILDAAWRPETANPETPLILAEVCALTLALAGATDISFHTNQLQIHKLCYTFLKEVYVSPLASQGTALNALTAILDVLAITLRTLPATSWGAGSSADIRSAVQDNAAIELDPGFRLKAEVVLALLNDLDDRFLA